MLLFKIISVALASLVLCLVVKKHSPMAAMAVAASGGMVMVLLVWEPVTQLIHTLESLGTQAALPEGYTPLILKVMGMTLACELGASLCREAGEEELSRKVEFASHVLLLSMAMPVLLAVVEMITQWAAL